MSANPIPMCQSKAPPLFSAPATSRHNHKRDHDYHYHRNRNSVIAHKNRDELLLFRCDFKKIVLSLILSLVLASIGRLRGRGDDPSAASSPTLLVSAQSFRFDGGKKIPCDPSKPSIDLMSHFPGQPGLNACVKCLCSDDGFIECKLTAPSYLSCLTRSAGSPTPAAGEARPGSGLATDAPNSIAIEPSSADHQHEHQPTNSNKTQANHRAAVPRARPIGAGATPTSTRHPVVGPIGVGAHKKTATPNNQTKQPQPSGRAQVGASRHAGPAGSSPGARTRKLGQQQQNEEHALVASHHQQRQHSQTSTLPPAANSQAQLKGSSRNSDPMLTNDHHPTQSAPQAQQPRDNNSRLGSRPQLKMIELLQAKQLKNAQDQLPTDVHRFGKYVTFNVLEHGAHATHPTTTTTTTTTTQTGELTQAQASPQTTSDNDRPSPHKVSRSMKPEEEHVQEASKVLGASFVIEREMKQKLLSDRTSTTSSTLLPDLAEIYNELTTIDSIDILAPGFDSTTTTTTHRPPTIANSSAGADSDSRAELESATKAPPGDENANQESTWPPSTRFDLDPPNQDLQHPPPTIEILNQNELDDDVARGLRELLRGQDSTSTATSQQQPGADMERVSNDAIFSIAITIELLVIFIILALAVFFPYYENYRVKNRVKQQAIRSCLMVV